MSLDGIRRGTLEAGEPSEPVRHASRVARLFLLPLAFALIGSSCTTGVDRAERQVTAPTPQGGPPADAPAPWLRRVQVVSVWPLAPDQDHLFGIDIPGVFTWWGARKVRRLHRHDRLAVVNVEGLGGEPELLDEYPELREAVSKDIYGNDARAEWYQSLQGAPEPVLVLSILSPVFQHYLVEQGKRAVDIGADAFYIDEIQTSALLIGRDRYAAGFSPLEMSAFERHLDELGLASPAEFLLSQEQADWLTDELASRLESDELNGLSVAELLRLPDQPLSIAQIALFEAYRRFQEDRAYQVMTRIIDRIRDYASERGRTLPIGANLAGMGGRTWWSPMMSMAWGSHLDFIVFENEVVPLGSPNTFLVSLPEGSFAPTYRLGRALTPGLVAAFPSVAFAPTLHDLEHYATYLSVMYAEAFAFEGNWALGWWAEEMDWPRDELAPDSLADLTRFVARWHRLYEGPRAPNPVAVLYANSSVLANPGRHDSYYGLCQALAELNVQYDVVYTGDDRFDDIPLAMDSLNGHEVVFVPTASDLTQAQVSALEGLVAEGGDVVALEPVSPALEETPGLRIIEDVGLAYRSGDREPALDRLEEIVGGVGRVHLSASGEGVLVTFYLRERLPGLVMHFVNERYRLLGDSVQAARTLHVRMERPSSFDDSWSLWVIASGARPKSVPYTIESGTIRFTLPELDVYAVAVFSANPPT